MLYHQGVLYQNLYNNVPEVKIIPALRVFLLNYKNKLMQNEQRVHCL